MIALAVVVALMVPTIRSTAAHAVDPDEDTLAVVAGLAKFAAFSQALANQPVVSDQLPFTQLRPGSSEGIGYDDVLKKAVADRAASAIHFSDLATAIGTDAAGIDLEPSGRHAVIRASTFTESDVEFLDLGVEITRTVDTGIDITSGNPRVVLESQHGVSVDLKATFIFRFGYDANENVFFLQRSLSPTFLELSATASVPDSTKIEGLEGILEVRGRPNGHFDEQLHGIAALADPDGDGRLAFDIVPGDRLGELTNNGADLYKGGFSSSLPSTLSAAIDVDAKPSAVAAMPSIPASVHLADPNLADTTPTDIQELGFDRYDRFSLVAAQNLNDAVGTTATAIQSMQMANPPAGGDVGLPFLQGKFSDAVQANKVLLAFLLKNTNPNDESVDAALRGQPKYSSIQQLFDRLAGDAGLRPAGGAITVSNVAYNEPASPGKPKLRFDLEISDPGSARALNPGGSPDPQTGAVRLGDALKNRAGIEHVNGANATATNRVGYDVKFTMVIDLEDTKLKAACVPLVGKNCPFQVTEKDGSAHVVTSLPLTADRFMLRFPATGTADFLTADALSGATPIHTAVDATGSVGFTGVHLGGTLDVRKSAGAAHLETISVKSHIFGSDADGDVPLRGIFDVLATDPGSLLDFAVNANAHAALTIDLPAKFPPDAGSPGGTPVGTATVDMADATDTSSISTSVSPEVAKLKDLAAPGDQVLGKIVDTLTHTAATLRALPTTGGTGSNANKALGAEVPVQGTPLGELVGSAELDHALADIAAKPPTDLQALVTLLDTDLGDASVSLDASGTPSHLLLDLTATHAIAQNVPVAFTFTLGGTAGHLVQTDGNALHLDGTSTAHMKLSIPVDTSAGPTSAAGIDVLPDSRVDVSVHSALAQNKFKATVGPLALNIGDGNDVAQGEGRLSVTLTDTTDSGPVKLNVWAQRASATFATSSTAACPGGVTGSGLALCFKLPAYKSPGTKLSSDPAKNNFIVRVPVPTAPAFDVSLSGTFDGTNPRIVVPQGLQAARDGSVLQLAQLKTGSDAFVGVMQSDIDRSNGQGKLPLLGDNVREGQDFLSALKAKLDAAFTGLPTDPNTPASTSGGATSVESQIEQKLNTNLSPFRHSVNATPECGGSPCGPAAKLADITKLGISFDVGQGAVSANAGCSNVSSNDPCRTGTVPFDIGIPGLALVKNADSTPLSVRVGWAFHFDGGLDKSNGFFVDPTKSPHELQEGVVVDNPAGTLKTNLIFLKTDVTSNGSAPAVTALFTHDLKPKLGSTLWTLHDLTAAPDLGKLFGVTTLDGATHIDWHLAVTDPFPGIGVPNFKIEWPWTGADATNPAAGGLAISFIDVGVDAQLLLKKLLGPLATRVGSLTKPFKPIIDTLYAPIPLLSDLSRLAGGDDITLVDLADAFSTLSGGPKLDLVKRVLKLESIVTSLNNPSSTGPLTIGSFTVNGALALQKTPTPDQVASMIGVTDLRPDLLSRLTQGDQAAIKAAESTVDGGFDFPILGNTNGQPPALMVLLMGGDVTLAHYDTGPLAISFTYEQIFGPVYAPPPVFVTLTGSAFVNAQLAAGYDTSGLRQAFETGQALDVLNGFFIDDFGPDGKERPEISFGGELGAGAQVSIAVLSVKVTGSIRLTVNLDLKDPNNDGKLHFGEFKNTVFNPICLFDASGNLAFVLTFGVTVGVSPFSASFSFDLVKITLLDIGVDISKSCPSKEPTLAHVQGNTMIVHAGDFGTKAWRGNGWGNDLDDSFKGKDEKVTVRSLHDRSTHEFRGFQVEMFGRTEQHLVAQTPGLDRVLVDARGYGGNETIALVGDGDPDSEKGLAHDNVDGFKETAYIFGGNGDDIITTGDGPAKVDGGGGTDHITTGRAGDAVAGGAGDDVITTFDGNDKVVGDGGLISSLSTAGCSTTKPCGAYAGGPSAYPAPGTIGFPSDPGAEADGDGIDNINLGLGTDEEGWGDGGNDSLIGGADGALALVENDPRQAVSTDGTDLLVGGKGNDHIEGGSGNDKLYGDEYATLERDDEPGAPGGGQDFIATGPGADEAHGGENNDRIVGESAPNQIDSLYGNGGDDTIFGGAGNDKLYGGRNADSTDGMLGADAVFGGPGDDLLTGGAGPDDIHGNADNDYILGDTGTIGIAKSNVLGSFRLVSAPTHDDDGADTIHGDEGSDVIFGQGGGDHVFGDQGNVRCAAAAPPAPEWTPPAESGVRTSDGRDVILGGDGNDDIIGDGVGDYVNGDTGNDLICGSAGDDTLLGDVGTDRIWGGSVGDQLFGDAGADNEYGNAGADFVYGGADDDHLEGNADNDAIHGDLGNDHIIGGSSTAAQLDSGDMLFGDSDQDVIVGDNGTVSGTFTVDPLGVVGGDGSVEVFDMSDALPTTHGGDDTISGGGDADLAFGGLVGDHIHGDDGLDHLEGNAGDDSVFGDNGSDDILGGSSPLASGAGATAPCPAGPTLGTPDVGETLLAGGDGNDVMFGDNGCILRTGAVSTADGTPIRTMVMLDRGTIGGDDVMNGDAGNDRMWGEVGDDTLDGGNDADYIEGNQGADTASGGTGSDDMLGGTSPVALPGTGDKNPIAANEPDTGDRMYGQAPNAATALADDDFLFGDNGVIDRCPSGGRDACSWSSESYGPFGSPAKRFFTLLGESVAATNHDGNDIMQGNSDSDQLYGENGNDNMHGNDAMDRMWGGYGADDMFGDAGVDSMIGDRANVTPVLLDGTNPAPQTISSQGPPPISENIYVANTMWFKVFLLDVTNGGNDRMFGGQGDDSMHGGAGADFMQGDDGFHVAGDPVAAGGNDRIFGDNGMDSLEGGPGRDHEWGGADQDDVDEIRGSQASTKVPSPPLFATITAYSDAFPPPAGKAYDVDPGARGADIIYGGHARDVLQGDDVNDRLVDSFGAYNLYDVCPAAYGGRQIIRALSPGLIGFMQQLGESDGAIGAALAVTDGSATGAGEVSIVYSSEATEDNAGSAYPTTPGHFTC
jgi:Ca2+-binding RTX toxin-like protein